MIQKIMAAVALGIALAAVPVYASTADAKTQDVCKAYYYEGWDSKTDICDHNTGYDKRNCTEVGFQVHLKDVNFDPWGLDGSGSHIGRKGYGCESKPKCPKPTHTTPHTTPPTTKPTTPATTRPTTRPTSTTHPTTATPTVTSTREAGVVGQQLPKTGPGLFAVGATVQVGICALVGGGMVIAASRRRRVNFRA